MSVELAEREVVSPTTTYTLDRKLGEGGFGQTFLAHDESGAEFALKMLRVERLESWKSLELFEREAAALASLDHPNIPAYVEFFATTENGPKTLEQAEQEATAITGLVLVQAYRQGSDLEARRKAGHRTSAESLERIALEVLQTLDYLHRQSPPIIHRDVTPKNIIESEDGAISLVDFGAITQSVHEATVGGSTTVGTLGFIPIEQSLGKARPASDLYALGVSLAVVASGSAPDNLPLDESTSKIDLVELGLRDSLSPKLFGLIDRLVEPLQAQRPSTAAQAIEVLTKGSALAPAGPTELDQPRASWKRTLFIMALGGSLGSAMIIYPLNFDNFSEDELVNMSPFWVLPAAFGFFGLVFQDSTHPIRNAILATVGTGFGLAFFLLAIFPSM